MGTDFDEQREFAPPGFAEEAMDMFRNDDAPAAGHNTAVPAANALQFLLECSPSGDGAQQLHAVVAAEGDEVQAALALVSNRFDVAFRQM